MVMDEAAELRAEIDALKQGHARLRERVAELESGLDQERRLHRRVAELTDLVQETLLPAPRRDDAKIAELLHRYSSQM